MITFKNFLVIEKNIDPTQNGISHLKDLVARGDSIVDAILYSPLVIAEKIDGMKFSIKKTDKGEIEYWSKNTRIDRPMSIVNKSWKILIDRLKKLQQKTNNFSELPNNSTISGEFLKSTLSNTVTYNKVPRGNWVIFSMTFNGNYIGGSHYKELHQWADYFESTGIPILFDGVLSEKQRKQIYGFINLSDEERLSKFKTVDFTTFIIEVIKPGYVPIFGNKIEGIVIYSNGKIINTNIVKLVDPIFTTQNNNKNNIYRPRIDELKTQLLKYVFDSINLDIINEIKGIVLSSNITRDRDSYITTIIDRLFMLIVGSPILKEIGTEFIDLREFLESKIELDYTLINPQVIARIRSDWVLKQLYIIMLIIFRQERKRRAGIFKSFTKEDFSKFNKLGEEIRGI